MKSVFVSFQTDQNAAFTDERGEFKNSNFNGFRAGSLFLTSFFSPAHVDFRCEDTRTSPLDKP